MKLMNCRLACGSCLLVVGSIADVIGNRPINLTGCVTVGCFIISCGLARSGIQLIVFRALQGISVSLCLPTSVSIVANSTPSGRKRNIGFSCLGFVQPIGFSLGLVLGGILSDTAGWRLGFYLCGALTLIFFFVGLWAVPSDQVVEGSNIKRLSKEIDWIGAGISCTCLSLFSYVLA
jgi:MFS family permease